MSPLESKTMMLLKFMEENEIAGRFVKLGSHPTTALLHDVARGIPVHKGFDIDIGEMYEVGGDLIALHDFDKVIVENSR